MSPDSGRPRIFHLITRLHYGGAEAKTIETVTGLDGYEFTVGYGAAFTPSQVDRLEQAGIGTRRFPLLRHYNPITSLFAVLTIAWFLRREEFDVIHTHSTEAGVVGRLAGALAGTPVVIHTVHGVPFAEDRHDLLNLFVHGCERLVAPLTDCLVTNADAIAEEYLDRGIGDADQYRTVYSGIDIDEFGDATPASGLPGDRPRVLMVGRLVEGKGFDVLLDAIEETTLDDYSICIAGDGPLKGELEDRIRTRELGDRVFLLGYREDVSNLMAASDVFVLPSFREGTPRVISEAMASGLPVIATAIAGIPEQVSDGENGYLIRPGEPNELAEALDRLLGDEAKRSEMGSVSSQRAEQFSRERMLVALDDVYRDYLSGTAFRTE